MRPSDIGAVVPDIDRVLELKEYWELQKLSLWYALTHFTEQNISTRSSSLSISVLKWSLLFM